MEFTVYDALEIVGFILRGLEIGRASCRERVFGLV